MKELFISNARHISVKEAKEREKAGWYALAATAILGVVLVAFQSPDWLKTILVMPATASALGFFQAWFQFGAGINLEKVLRAVRSGRIDSISRNERYALMLIAGAVLSGIAVTLSAFTT